MKWKNALEESKDYRKNFDEAMKKFHNGRMKIEFMKNNNNIELYVEFDNQLKNILNINGKNLVKFSSPDKLLSFIYDNFGSRYGFSDMKAASREVFDYKEMNDIFDQIKNYIKEYPQKARSLTYNKSHAKPGEEKSNWDMEVVFRRSIEKWSKNASNYRIHPAITGKNEIGNIIGKDEIEVQ